MGHLSFSVYDGYNYSVYKEPSVRTTQRKNTAGAWAQYYGFFGKFTVLSTLGIENMYMKSSLSNDKDCEWRPSVRADVYYKPLNNLRLSLGYSFYTAAPSISQLSQTDQWLDTRLVFHGNPDLHTYTSHNLTLGATFDSRYLEFSLSARYTDMPGRICENFQTAPDYMLETLINLDKYRELCGQLDFTVKPLGSTVWEISCRIIAGTMKGASPGYDWTGSRFQLMPYPPASPYTCCLFLRQPYEMDHIRPLSVSRESNYRSAHKTPNTGMGGGILLPSYRESIVGTQHRMPIRQGMEGIGAHGGRITGTDEHRVIHPRPCQSRVCHVGMERFIR